MHIFVLHDMKKFSLFLIILISFFACDEADKKYSCSASGCIEDLLGAFNSLELCSSNCLLDDGQPSTMVTVFLYENCPIAQYMCGPLREAYRYFCDTLKLDSPHPTAKRTKRHALTKHASSTLVASMRFRGTVGCQNVREFRNG